MDETEKKTKGYVKVYNLFFDSTLLTYYEKMIFLSIKRFSNSITGEAFPSLGTLERMTGISKRQIQRVINSLSEKGLLEVRQRFSEGKTNYLSNLYILYDFEELWEAETLEELQALIKMKKLEPVPTTAQIQANSHFSNQDYDIEKNETCQERYSQDDIRQQICYQSLLYDNPDDKTVIDTCVDIIYDVVNTQKTTIRVMQEDKPVNVVISRLRKLNQWDIEYAITKFKSQTNRMHNARSYMLTQLYNAHGDSDLDIQNRVNHDLYGQVDEN